MESPAVTVVIPVYNRAELVRESIESALAATVAGGVEVVVVDDASTDGTWAALEACGDARVRPLRLSRNAGQSAARNHGLEAARGRYVKFLDSDDVLLPDHLSSEVQAMEEDGSEIAVSGWSGENADGTTTSYEPPVFHSIVDDVLAGRAVPTSAALYRTDRAGRWDSALRKLDDWDYFCQAALGASKITTVPGAAYRMRHHSGERATDAGMLANAREHHAILRKIEQRLDREGRLTEPRRRRLAQYFYKELRVLCLHDDGAFASALRHIEELYPHFVPREEEQQPFMRVLARMIGVRRALRLHTAIKRAVKRTTG